MHLPSNLIILLQEIYPTSIYAQVNYPACQISHLLNEEKEMSTAGHSTVVCLGRGPQKIQGAIMEWEADVEWRKRSQIVKQ